MYIVLLFLLVSNFFTTAFAMDDTSLYPFYDIVNKVNNGYNVEIAEKEIKELYESGKNPDGVLSEKTAVGLSLGYCVSQQPNFFENQLSILALLLSSNEKEALNFNKKYIINYLDLKSQGLRLCFDGLRKRPFSGIAVHGGGIFIDDDEDDEDDQRISNMLTRINQVRERVESLNDNN